MPTNQVNAAASNWAEEGPIRAAARGVLARPEYELDRREPFVDAGWFRELIEWLLAPFRWLDDALGGMPEAVRWVVIGLLVLVLVALIAHIIWSLTSTLKPPALSKLKLGSDEDSAIDPARLEAEARELAAAGDHVGDCRRLLQAALAWLQTIRKRRFRPGLTNTELLREYAATPVADPLRQLVRTIDTKWYGDEPCHEADYEQCHASHARIRETVQERRSVTEKLGAVT